MKDRNNGEGKLLSDARRVKTQNREIRPRKISGNPRRVATFIPRYGKEPCSGGVVPADQPPPAPPDGDTRERHAVVLTLQMTPGMRARAQKGQFFGYAPDSRFIHLFHARGTTPSIKVDGVARSTFDQRDFFGPVRRRRWPLVTMQFTFTVAGKFKATRICHHNTERESVAVMIAPESLVTVQAIGICP